MTAQTLIDFAREQGGLGTDDLLAVSLPLLHQVADVHASGLVAPLRGIDALDVDDRFQLRFDPDRAITPERQDRRVATVLGAAPGAVEVVGHTATTADVLAGTMEVHSLDVLGADEAVTRPVLVPAWETWEHRIDHHDALTDIASLGALLAALSAGLDLGLADDVDRLAKARDNLFAIAPDLHPVVGQVVMRMLDPDRRRRAQDLASIIDRLETYRDQPLDLDLAGLASTTPVADRRSAVLGVLRDRLFDLSRRNRLIWFRQTQQSLNLTEVSVPLVLDARNIRPEQLYTWSRKVADEVISGRQVSLGSIIRWQEAPYASGVLDTLISTARRDRSEYGQAQLRLVAAFLRWHDLKGDIDERISSPLLLVPVSLTKKRGVRDTYVLQAESSEAEVNPSLRHLLRQLYALELPATVDLSTTTVADLHASLAAAIGRSEPAVVLTLQDRPRIELIHQRALIRVEAFQRRAGRGNATVARRVYAYSYRRRDYRPLGIQIYRDSIAVRQVPLAITFGAVPEVRAPSMAPSIVNEARTYALDDQGTGNPYAWDIDLCAVTLANFNYRTMSLVRDYRELLETGLVADSFDRIFSFEPKPLEPAASADLPPGDRFLVVPADGSQIAAIAKARGGASIVIQGPPGTGKSQTITNLIADYVARGKRVLFVCQKRAAIDVVYARLRQRGLDELSCLIHDSQADKKAFVHALRTTYEAWLAGGETVDDAELRRTDLLREVAGVLDQIERYEAVLARPAGDDGPTLRSVIERLIELRAKHWGDDLDPGLRRLLPRVDAWWHGRPAADAVAAALDGAGGRPVLADSVVRYLAPEVLDAVRPDSEVAFRARDATREVRALQGAVEGAAGERAELGLGALTTIVSLGGFMAPLATRGRGAVLRASSESAETLRKDVRAWTKLQSTLAKADKRAEGWQDPPGPAEASSALAVARAKEGSFFRILSGDWRRAAASVKRGYRVTGKAAPSVTDAFERLVAAHDARAAMDEAAEESDGGWGYPDPVVLAERIQAIRDERDPEVARWRDRIADDAGSSVGPIAVVLDGLRPDLARTRDALAGLVVDVDDLPLDRLTAMLDALADPSTAPLIRATARPLAALAEHPEVAVALRRLAATPDEIEYAVMAATLDELSARERDLARLDGGRLDWLIAEVESALPRLYSADAAAIIARVRERFVRGVAHAALSVTGMSPEGRAEKKTWTVGRRELENEFRKTMRYRSIRDLASDDSGTVVAALRPIWLMSPTSVSDTLPLDPNLFDVVIYDEASQIPVEEAVPAMHRSHQVIVVGDRMQLPPTTFFAARADASDDDADDDREVGVVLDGDSFLAQAAGRLASTMLTWHYRSRSEALIAFSNAAFYEGRLATIPDRTPAPSARDPITVTVAGDGSLDDEAGIVAGVDALLARPISLHRLSGSVYTHRTNPAEATYIAGLVRDLLARQTGLTIGICAFSEAQQTEIERALERLADTDPVFEALYEAELVREDDDQVVGLFVKNLENVQGDERDVIIMSVCYGPDPDGRMVMNFGPINQDGGEKRLNVIFSRARVHMAIVSSIDPEAITNTYNDGANTLRRFLQYAAAVSRGDPGAARSILAGFGDRRTQAGAPSAADPAIVGQLASALRERGLVVAERVGQSAFRCDLALRRQGDTAYRVAVLVDHAQRIAAEPLAERILNHPAVLRATGWRVVHVLGRDWCEDPSMVLDRIVRLVDDPEAAPEPREVAIDEPELVLPASPAGTDASTTSDGDIERTVATDSLVGSSVCFTGGSVCSIGGVRLTRDDQERLATEAGLEVRQVVSARLDLLVLADPTSTSTKARRAGELGIRRMAEPAFWRTLGVEID